MNTDHIAQSEHLQIEIHARLGILRPHLPVAEAVPILNRIFQSLRPLDGRIGQLDGLIDSQRAFLASVG